MGSRWPLSQFPIDLELPYMLIITLQHAKWHMSAMTVPRLTMKVKEWAEAQFLEASTHPPK